MKQAHAYAKFTLSGEHSLIYQGGGIALPLKTRQLKLQLIENTAKDTVILNGLDTSSLSLPTVYNLFQAMELDPQTPFSLEINSDIPIGMGLGSSAAFCTALARAFHPNSSADDIAKLAHKGEHVIHGVSSGFDPHACAIAEPLYFSAENSTWRALSLEQFREENLCFVLLSTNLAHTTKKVISKTQQVQATLNDKLWQQHIEQLANYAHRSISLLENSPTLLGPLMTDIQSLLRAIGVSNRALEEKIEHLTSLGALGAKLTGAGCGGYVVGLFRKEQLQKTDIQTLNPIIFE